MIKNAYNRLKAKAFSKKDTSSGKNKIEKLYQAALVLEQEDKKQQQRYFNQKEMYSPQLKEVANQIKQSEVMLNFPWPHEIPYFIKIMRAATLPHSDFSISQLDRTQAAKVLTMGYKIDMITNDCLLFGCLANVLCPIIFKIAELEGITLDPIAHKALYGDSPAKA